MEREIEAYMRKAVEDLGGVFFKFVSPGNDGVPDRIAVLPGGSVIFIELKDDHGKVSQLQEWQIGRLLKRGCVARVVRGMKEAQEVVRMMKAAVPVMPEEYAGGADPWRMDK